MAPADYTKLLADVVHHVRRTTLRLGILGATPTAADLIRDLRDAGLDHHLVGMYGESSARSSVDANLKVKPVAEIHADAPDIVAVAADAEKEELLTLAGPYIHGAPRILVAGYQHYRFQDSMYEQALEGLPAPSLANGYPNSRIHLYQCLVNAHRLDLKGDVAEFGVYRAGTTLFMARILNALGEARHIYAFDTFEGFPPRRTHLDMYDDPGCVHTDLAETEALVDGKPITIVPGDIVDTAQILAHRPLVLSFIDTDNYSSANAAIRVVAEQTVIGGAIVFDHLTGTDRFRYTLGERMAAKQLLDDDRYFHLHGTGVFYRQR